MKRRSASMIAIAAVCSALLAGAGPASGTQAAAALAAPGGTWGNAKEVAAGLNQGGEGQLNSVSCASAGNCSAGGYYTDAAGHFQAFVVSAA